MAKGNNIKSKVATIKAFFSSEEYSTLQVLQAHRNLGNKNILNTNIFFILSNILNNKELAIMPLQKTKKWLLS